MSLKEFFEKRKIIRNELLRKKLLIEQAKKKKEMENYPKCKKCGKPYIEELSGTNEYYHKRGFCKENCMDGYMLINVKEIRQYLSVLDRSVVDLDSRIKEIDDKIKKIVTFLLKEKKRRSGK